MDQQTKIPQQEKCCLRIRIAGIVGRCAHPQQVRYDKVEGRTLESSLSDLQKKFTGEPPRFKSLDHLRNGWLELRPHDICFDLGERSPLTFFPTGPERKFISESPRNSTIYWIATMSLKEYLSAVNFVMQHSGYTELTDDERIKLEKYQWLKDNWKPKPPDLKTRSVKNIKAPNRLKQFFDELPTNYQQTLERALKNELVLCDDVKQQLTLLKDFGYLQQNGAKWCTFSSHFERHVMDQLPNSPIKMLSEPMSAAKATLIQHKLDVATPDKVDIDKEFCIAVAVCLPNSTWYENINLSNIKSAQTQLDWSRDASYVPLQIQIHTFDAECKVLGNTSYRIRVYKNQDSLPVYFMLLPRVEGTITIDVKLYQEEYVIGNAVTYTSVVKQVGEVRLDIISKPIILPKQTMKELRTLLASLYTTDLDIRRILSDAGFDYSRANFSASPINIWFSVLEEAKKTSSSLLSIIDCVNTDYPNAISPKLRNQILNDLD